MKTPKYDGKVSWEAFHAQFELLAKSQNWSQETKALQLAMCLTDEALACLLLLDVDDRAMSYWWVLSSDGSGTLQERGSSAVN